MKIAGCVTFVWVKSSFEPSNIILEISNSNISSAFVNKGFIASYLKNRS